MFAKSVAGIDVETIIKMYHNYYFDYDDPNASVEQDTEDESDYTETHYFETEELGEAFLATRCNKFHRCSSQSMIYKCLHGLPDKPCTAYAKWFRKEKKVIISFRHTGHNYLIGQGRLNECQARIIEFFTIFFWRKDRSSAWNQDNICYCFKRWFDLNSTLSFISFWDIAALKLKIAVDYEETPRPKTFWHYAIQPREHRMKKIPYPPSTEQQGQLGDWVFKGFTDKEWNDVGDNVWVMRNSSKGPAPRVISGKAFHMAKHVLEFVCHYIRLAYAVTVDKDILGDMKYLREPEGADYKFAEFMEKNFNIFKHVEELGFTMLIFWERQKIVELNDRAVRKFNEEGAIKMYGKLVSGSTVRLPEKFSYPSREVDAETGVPKQWIDPDTINQPQVVSDIWNRFGINKILQVVVPMLQRFTIEEPDEGETNSGSSKGESSTTSHRQTVKREGGTLERNPDQKTMDLERYENTMRRLKTTYGKRATIWNCIQIPDNNYISSRLYRMTGIPLKKNWQRINSPADEKVVAPQLKTNGEAKRTKTTTLEKSFKQGDISVKIVSLGNNQPKSQNKNNKKKNKNKKNK